MVFRHPFLLCLMLCLGLSTGFSALGKSEFTRTVQTGYQDMLKLKLMSGQKHIQQALQQDASNICALHVQNYADCFTLLLTDDAAQYDRLMEQQQKRVNRIAAIKEKTPYKRFAESEIYLQMALCKLKFGNELQAAWDFRKAYLLLEENARLYPGFVQNRKSLGLLHILIGSVPQKYQWVLSTFGFKGSVKQGRQELALAADAQHAFRTEATIIEAIVNEFLYKEATTSTDYFKVLTAEHPDNLLFHFLCASVLKKLKRGEQALQYLEKRPTGAEYMPFHYLHHMLGDLYLYKGDYNRSINENLAFLKYYKGSNYLKDARYKLYLAYILKGDPATAQKHLTQVKSAGQLLLEEDKYAQEAATTADMPQPQLLKARLLTDGGYFQDAMKELNSYDLNSAKNSELEKVEYYYRKARVLHSLNQTDQAKAHYLRTVQLAGATPVYFAPNSCLQLGYIYQTENDPDNARKFFNKALAYPKHEYKNSIDSKAKLALASMP